MDLRHPFDSSTTLEDDLKRNIFNLLTQGPVEVARKRAEIFQHYEAVKDQLRPQECALHDAMGPLRERLVRNKQFLLFQHMAQDAGVCDDGLLDLLLNGVKLVGQAGPTGQFEEQVNPPAMSILQLMRSARWSQKMIMGRGATKQDAEVRQNIWEGALEEVEKGWLSGPYTVQQVQELVGPLYIVSRRFGLVQSDKVRPIDDMSESLVNASFGTSYKLDLPGIDGVAVLARTMLEAVSAEGKVKLALTDGCFLKGMLHHSISVSDARRLVGRTLDLEAAYKQVLTARDGLWVSVLAVDDMQGHRHLFLSNVLPFGASAAVYSFNRLARAISTIGARIFGLCWQNYYDDFPQLDFQFSGGAAQECAEKFLDLIGWTFSRKESKRRVIASEFDVLGVTFDFRRTCKGEIIVRNKAQRVQQVLDEVSEILQSQALSAGRAMALRGRLQFMESQVFGRLLSANLRVFQDRATGKLAGHFLTDTLKDELLWIQDFLRMDAPRVLKAGMSEDRFLIFTDAALESADSAGSIGMVAYHMSGIRCLRKVFFSDVVPPEILGLMQKRTLKVISTLELAASFLGVFCLLSGLCGFRVFLFCDNEAARASLISMYSPVVVHNELLKALGEAVVKSSLFLWTARVPSHSNVADAPSRLVVDQLLQDGFEKIEVPWHELRQLLA